MSELDPCSGNAAQIDYWNATAGRTWAAFQEQLDRQIEPLGAEAIRALAPAVGERIIDVGCGCGQSTLALATQVTASGTVIGVDISAPMLAVAKSRAVPPEAASPEFSQLDAQTGALGEGVFDAAFSRFGVMFFSEPVDAFSNLRKAVKPGGRLVFVCWRSYEENLWMRAPMEAAQPFLPPPAPIDPATPGPFSFANPKRVRSILSGAGFSDVTIDPFDAEIGGSNLEKTLDLAFRVGPLGTVLREHPHLAPIVTKAVCEKLVDYQTPDGIFMPAAVWIVRGISNS